MIDVRRRFWMEIALLLASMLFLVATVAIPDWIEAVSGLDPDGGNGMVERGIVAVLVLGAAALSVIARREWRLAIAESS